MCMTPLRLGMKLSQVEIYLTELGLNLKFSKHVIKAKDGPFIGATSPMVDLGAYLLKDLNTRKVKPEEYFTEAYVEEVYE